MQGMLWSGAMGEAYLPSAGERTLALTLALALALAPALALALTRRLLKLA